MDQGIFVMVGSDVDDEEIKSFISQKRLKIKKLSRKRKRNADSKKKSSSGSSSPASSSPQHSDDSTVRSGSSLSAAFWALQAEQNEQTNRAVDDNTNGMFTTSNKKLRTESNTCGAYPNKKNSLSSLSCVNGVNSEVTLPSAWHSVNSSHYVFSSDEELSETESKSSDRHFPKNQKGHSFPKTLASWKMPTACLTSCRSCTEYILPNLSEQDSSEMSSYVALDCEFVGVGPKKESSLGRCSIVNPWGQILFDRFVKPPEEITDYRTPWSGLRPRNIRCGIPFIAAQEMIAAIIKDKVVIGHAVHNDFRVMGLKHPVHLIRDTARCKLLCDMANLPGNVCALRKLTSALLGRSIQKKEHCSVTDARACMDLFRLVRIQWEPTLQAKFKRRAARQSLNNIKVTDSVNNSGAEPQLNSFFDDQYWPEDMFKDALC